MKSAIKVIFIIVLLGFLGCAKEGAIDLGEQAASEQAAKAGFTVTSANLVNGKIQLSGNNLTNIHYVEIEYGGSRRLLQTESQTSSSYVGFSANFPTIDIVMGSVYNLFVHSAQGVTVVPIQVTLANNSVDTVHLMDNSVTSSKLDFPSATNGDVLTFDGANWNPAAPSGGGGGGTYYRGTGLSGSGSVIADGEYIHVNRGTGSGQMIGWSEEANPKLVVPHTNYVAIEWDRNEAGTGAVINFVDYDSTGPTIYREFHMYNENEMFKIEDVTAGADRLTINSTGTVNVPGNVTVGGTNVCLQNGTNCPAAGGDSYSLDGSGTGSTDVLFITQTDKVGILTTSATMNLGFDGEGAKDMGVERRSTPDTAGSSFTINAGGATTGATDKAGGSLLLSSGVSTGDAGSRMEFWTAKDNQGAGTTDRAPTASLVIDEQGDIGIGTANPGEKLEIENGHLLLDGAGIIDPIYKLGDGGGVKWSIGLDDAGHASGADALVIANNDGLGTNERIVLTPSGDLWLTQLCDETGAACKDVTNIPTVGATEVGATSLYVGTNTGAGTDVTTFQNTGIGYAALGSVAAGDSNTAIGYQALNANVAGSNNVAIGKDALLLSTASNNMAVGFNSMDSNTTGFSNVGIGNYTLQTNSTGSRNVAVGYEALNSSTVDDSTAIGHQALKDNSTGTNNTAVGYTALTSNTTGQSNVAVGHAALGLSTDGNNSVAIGLSSIGNFTTSSHNVAVGHNALLGGAGATGNSNIAIGSFAADAVTTGSDNIGIGRNAVTAVTTGIRNVGVGRNALQSVTNTNYSTGIGYQAAGNNTAGWITAVGSSALLSNTSGQRNTAVGAGALQSNVTSNGNTAVGFDALTASTAVGQTAVGSQALILNTTGGYNTALGDQAGEEITTGANNVFIGYSAGSGLGDISDDLVIMNAQSSATPLIRGEFDTGEVWISQLCDETGANCNDVSAGFGGGDNLGNHTATGDLDMAGNWIGGDATGGEGIFIATDGKIGINKNAPAVAVDALGYYRSMNTSADATPKTAQFLGLQHTNANGDFVIFKGDSAAAFNNLNIGGGSATVDGATQINFYTTSTVNSLATTARMHIDGNGLVGIGETTPANLLHLDIGATGNSIINIERNGQPNYIGAGDAGWIFSGIAQGTMGIRAASKLEFGVGNNRHMSLNSSGFFGVGATDPGATLPNGWNTDGNERIFEVSGTSSTGDVAVQLHRNDQSMGLDIWHDSSAGVSYFDSLYNNDAGDIHFRTKTLGTPVDAMTIQGDGLVGIGTTTPNQDLSIQDDTDGAGLRQTGNTDTVVTDYARTYAVGSRATSLVRTYRDASTHGYTDIVAYGGTGASQYGNIRFFASGGSNQNLEHMRIEGETGEVWMKLLCDETGNNCNDMSTGPFVTGLGIYETGTSTFGGTNAGAADDGSSRNNVGVGQGALQTVATGQNNVALGYQALNVNTGNNNVAIGYQSGLTTTSGLRNVGVGTQTLDAHTSGNNNTAIGHTALSAVTTGGSNTAVGYQALIAYDGDNATAVGALALTALTTGIQNVAVGYATLDTTTTEQGNTAIGYGAGTNNTANYNTYLGAHAGQQGTTGHSNVAVGYQALRDNTAGGFNVAIGLNALRDNTASTSSIAIGYYSMANGQNDYSIAIGTRTLEDVNATNNNLVAIGYESLMETTTGVSNTAVGYHTLRVNTTGANNIAIGDSALDVATSASNNIAIGKDALGAQTTGGTNIAIGTNSMLLANGALDSVAIGYGSLDSVSNGNGNVALGRDAGQSITTGDGNIAIGYQAMDLQATANYNVAIGYQALETNVGGGGVTAVGYRALATTTGANNTAFGSLAMEDVSTGTDNVAIGQQAMLDATTSSSNVAIGRRSLISQGAGSNSNVAIGWESGKNIVTGDSNVAIGYQAGDGAGDVSNRLFIDNGHANGVLIGGEFDTGEVWIQQLCDETGGACKDVTTIPSVGVLETSTSTYAGTNAGVNDDASSNGNAGFGQGSLNAATSGDQNVAIGYNSLNLLTTGQGNVSLGYQALSSLTTGSRSIAIGQNAMQSASGGSNTAIGYRALQVASGGFNIAIGFQTGDAISTGTDNIVLGANAGGLMNTGGSNIVIGSNAYDAATGGSNAVAVGHNSATSSTSSNLVAVGYDALRVNVTGVENTAIGYQALENNTGSANTAVGFNALTTVGANGGNVAVGDQAAELLTGRDNVALGYRALETATSADYNVAIGTNSLNNATNTGDYNVAVGFDTLSSTTTGANNTALGTNAGLSITTGISNVAIGHNALDSANVSNTVAVGKDALAGLTSGGENTAVGYSAFSSSTTAASNTGVGYLAGNSTTGANNTFIGAQSGENVTTGIRNVGIGYRATRLGNGGNNIGIGYTALAGGVGATGGNNVSIGSKSMEVYTTGNNSVAIGDEALSSVTTGSGNTSIGYLSGRDLISGNNNTYLGYNAGETITTGSDNVMIGYGAGDGAAVGTSNKLIIGNGGFGALIEGEFDTGEVWIDQLCDETGANCNDLSAGLGGGTPAVAFYAYQSANFGRTNNTWQTMSVTTETFDDGADHASGTFTAPEDGTYMFSVTACYTNVAVGSWVEVAINIAGTRYTLDRTVVANAEADDHCLSGSLTMTMNNADTAIVQTYSNDFSWTLVGTAVVQGDRGTSFSGHQLN